MAFGRSDELQGTNGKDLLKHDKITHRDESLNDEEDNASLDNEFPNWDQNQEANWKR
jgi:hypothetical protein